MDKKISRHEWKSNLLPALVMVGPVTLVLVFLVAVPLLYVGVMSFWLWHSLQQFCVFWLDIRFLT